MEESQNWGRDFMVEIVRRDGGATQLAAIIVVQAICAAVFVRDVLGDLGTPDTLWHLGPEISATASLAGSSFAGRRGH